MSDNHKAALAEGRTEGAAVRRYLDVLVSQRPRRGRKRTAATVERQLKECDANLVDADPFRALHLRQQRHDLEDELTAMDAGDGGALAEAEEGFVAVAAAYGTRKGISYGVWREAGVPAATLRRAGISR